MLPAIQIKINKLTHGRQYLRMEAFELIMSKSNSARIQAITMETLKIDQELAQLGVGKTSFFKR